MQKKNKGVIVALLLFFLALGVGLAYSELNELIFESSIDLTISYFQVSIIICLQLLVLLMSSYLWINTLRINSNYGLSFIEATQHVGLILISKYIPGKLWGLGARYYLLSKKGLESKSNLNSMLFEQYFSVVFSSLVGLSLLLIYIQPLIGILSLVTVVLTPNLTLSLLQRLATLLKIKNIKTRKEIHYSELLLFSFKYFIYLLLHGLVATFILSIFYEEISLSVFFIVTGSFHLAVVAGYLSIVFPGGIGIREGAWVAILINFISLEAAISLSIYHRLWTIISDILMGLTTTTLMKQIVKEE